MWSEVPDKDSRKLGSALNYQIFFEGQTKYVKQHSLNLNIVDLSSENKSYLKCQYLPSPAEGTGFVIRCSNTTAGAKPATGSQSDLE